jgi:putative SOS response-associated peptidase YedK
VCGRFVQCSEPEIYASRYAAEGLSETRPRYNLAPTQRVLAIRLGKDRHREILPMRWGLVPAWSEGPDSRYSMINARAETAATKPAYRSAFKARRCLIPADGFYEWRALPTGKQPYYVRRRDGEPFAMAGLWERWTSAGDQTAIESCTIIVTDANQAIAPIHDRMPAILEGDAIEAWLDPANRETEALSALLQPAPARDWTFSPVSKRVNSPRNEGPELIEPIAISETR